MLIGWTDSLAQFSRSYPCPCVRFFYCYYSFPSCFFWFCICVPVFVLLSFSLCKWRGWLLGCWNCCGVTGTHFFTFKNYDTVEHPFIYTILKLFELGEAKFQAYKATPPPRRNWPCLSFVCCRISNKALEGGEKKCTSVVRHTLRISQRQHRAVHFDQKLLFICNWFKWHTKDTALPPEDSRHRWGNVQWHTV